jgi:hypothetical protein
VETPIIARRLKSDDSGPEMMPCACHEPDIFTEPRFMKRSFRIKNDFFYTIEKYFFKDCLGTQFLLLSSAPLFLEY